VGVVTEAGRGVPCPRPEPQGSGQDLA
jgi:hypothetical protein